MLSNNPENWLLFTRIVRFGETDAAGVIHFHNLLRWCHEAWEDSLCKYGLNYSDIFPSGEYSESRVKIALPIVHCEANFRFPIKAGDNLEITLVPEKVDMTSFQVQSKFKCDGKQAAQSIIRHIAINPETRQRCDLPEDINRWLEASSINLGPRPL